MHVPHNLHLSLLHYNELSISSYNLNNNNNNKGKGKRIHFKTKIIDSNI